ncbi:uncharacterized protein [Hetaerina americana]|uniref:uncharacterized protein n=1 Tax=Hetaerina americana TaxID=62018 RepID=UPI003A7F32A2
MSQLSSHVSREALVKSLESLTGRKDVELLDFQVQRASNAVEGFASLVLRVKVSYRLPGNDNIDSHALIVKSLPQTEFQKNFVRTTDIFSREWLVLSRIAPMMKSISAGRVEVPLPTCYHGICDSDDSAFYMDDLVALGYRAVHRSSLMDGLDYAHCSIVMKRLGCLHALTLAAERALDPGSGGWAGLFPELTQDKVYYDPGPGDPPAPAQTMIASMLQNFKDICGQIDGLPKMAVASGALDRVLQGVYPTLCRLKQTPPVGRHVLTHGDCWMNNMMFRYKKGDKAADEPADVKFFDLQLAKCCHPSTDLLYFMHLSTRRPLREKYLNTLIEEYYGSFTESLKTLEKGSPPFSLEDFKADYMEKYKPYGLIVGVLYSPLQMLGDDFLLPNAEDLTNEKVEQFFQDGGTQKIMNRFQIDSIYRSYVKEIAREFLDMALPYGLESVESSPLLVTPVN